MKNTKILRLVIGLILSLSFFTKTFAEDSNTANMYYAHFLAKKAPKIDKNVLVLALNAYEKAKLKGVVKHHKLTVIDYSLPSTVPRMWVFDLEKNALLHELHVTHGAKSGALKATQFSNRNESHQSSLGVFLTKETYHGRQGYSLRLDGLEQGINDNARRRGIVIHGADYATETFASKYGRLGLSHGCPAIDPKVLNKVIADVKNGGIVFAYYPDVAWMKQSRFF